MKNRIICLVVCLMTIVGCSVLCICGIYKILNEKSYYLFSCMSDDDRTFTYTWAQIKLPDGAIIEGKVDSWTDYGDELLQITINGTTYLVHAADAVMKT